MPKRDAHPIEPGSSIYSDAAQALDDAGVSFALIGGLAANVYRRSRPARVTVDIDFAVEAVDDAGLLAIEQSLGTRGWKLARVLRDDDGTPFLAQFDLDKEGLRAHVDCMFAGTEFERMAIASAGDDHLVRPEYLLVYKLIAGRAHDRDDIDAVLADNRVDEAEVRRWAQAWEVEDRWDLALRRRERSSSDD